MPAEESLMAQEHKPTSKPQPLPHAPGRKQAEKERVKPVVPAEQSLIESHSGPELPDVKPVGE